MYHLPKPKRRNHITITQTTYEPPTTLLHMYENVPSLPEIEIDEFEDLIIERYLLLRVIENAKRRGLKTDTIDWRNFIRESIRIDELKSYFYFFRMSNGKSESESLRNDHLSHYFLRLACCKTFEMRRWFTELELQLFGLKFFYLTPTQKNALYKTYCKYYQPLTGLEKLLIKDELIACSDNIVVDVDDVDFYAVPFYQAINSVSARDVYMEDGNVYLPEFRLREPMQYLFGEKLKTGLSEMTNCLRSVERDERIKNILDNLNTLAITKQKTTRRSTKNLENRNEVRVEDVDLYAKNHYPLCMYSLHEHLTTTHHLKHDARIQYGRFLKELGFDCEQVLSIFREHFCQEMNESKFLKKYSYSIKYMYGLIGRKIAQNAYSCAKILEKDVVCGGEYGCPYKHWDKEKLTNVLCKKGLALPDIEDIIRLKQKGQYQNACTRCFDCTHTENYSKLVQHPNEYFKESRERIGIVEVLKARIQELDEVTEID